MKQRGLKKIGSLSFACLLVAISVIINANTLDLTEDESVPVAAYLQLKKELEDLKEEFAELQAYATSLATALTNRAAISVERLDEIIKDRAQLYTQFTVASDDLEHVMHSYKKLATEHHDLRQAFLALSSPLLQTSINTEVEVLSCQPAIKE